MGEQKKQSEAPVKNDTDLLGAELRRRIALLILTKPQLATQKGWGSKKDFVRQAVSAELAKYE